MFISKLKNFEIIRFLFFLIVAFALYGWNIDSPFLFDDMYNIFYNNFVQDLNYFTRYFIDPRTHNGLPENAPYRPLCTLAYALLWAVGGGSTIPFHIYKIALHTLAGWLSFRIFEKVLARSSAPSHLVQFAFLGSLIFLVHPANSESVNFISSASTVQCAVFYLAAFLSYLDKRYLIMTLFFLGSVFTKEEGATFPAILVLYEIIFSGGKINKRAIGLASGALCFYLLVYLNLPKTVQFSNVDSLTYLFTQFRAWIKYLFWIFVPIDFSIEHLGFGFSPSFWDTEVILSLALTVILVGGSLYLFWRYRSQLSIEVKAFVFGLLSFYLVMMPSSSVFALSEPINEHRYYLSYAFFIPSLVVLFKKVPLSKNIVGPAIALVLVTLSALTLRQVNIWKTPMGIWKNAVEIDSNNPRAHLNLGIQYLERGQYETSIPHFIRCQELSNRYSLCSVNLGLAWGALGNIERAETFFVQAFEWAPKSTITTSRYAEFLIDTKRDYLKGLQMLALCEENSLGDPGRCIKGKSKALRELGRLNESLEAAEYALQLNPGLRVNQFELGLTLLSLNKLDEAYNVFAKILAQNPGDLQSLHNMAWIEMQRKNWAHSLDLWREKLKVNLEDKLTWRHIKVVAEQLQDKVLIAEADKRLKE